MKGGNAKRVEKRGCCAAVCCPISMSVRLPDDCLWCCLCVDCGGEGAQGGGVVVKAQACLEASGCSLCDMLLLCFAKLSWWSCTS